MAPRETANNAYAKFGDDKQNYYGVLWYFLEWSISYFTDMPRNTAVRSIITKRGAKSLEALYLT